MRYNFNIRVTRGCGCHQLNSLVILFVLSSFVENDDGWAVTFEKNENRIR